MPAGYDHNDLASWWGADECPVCGRWFLASRRRVQQLYCSPRCAARFNYIRRRQGIAVTVNTRCAHCNDILVEPKPNQKFCSASCKSMAVKRRKLGDRILDRVCLECGASIPDDAQGRQKYCSLECTRKFNQRRSSERRSKQRAADRPGWSALTCQVCGAAFTVTKRTDAKYCSAACNQRAHRARKANGDAAPNGHDPQRMTTAPPLPWNPTIPEVQAALAGAADGQRTPGRCGCGRGSAM